MTRLASLALALATLAGCTPPASTDAPNDLATVCAEQAAMAQAGRTDGRPQTITCPE